MQNQSGWLHGFCTPRLCNRCDSQILTAANEVLHSPGREPRIAKPTASRSSELSGAGKLGTGASLGSFVALSHFKPGSPVLSFTRAGNKLKSQSCRGSLTLPEGLRGIQETKAESGTSS